MGNFVSVFESNDSRATPKRNCLVPCWFAAARSNHRKAGLNDELRVLTDWDWYKETIGIEIGSCRAERRRTNSLSLRAGELACKLCAGTRLVRQSPKLRASLAFHVQCRVLLVPSAGTVSQRDCNAPDVCMRPITGNLKRVENGDKDTPFRVVDCYRFRFFNRVCVFVSLPVFFFVVVNSLLRDM